MIIRCFAFSLKTVFRVARVMATTLCLVGVTNADVVIQPQDPMSETEALLAEYFTDSNTLSDLVQVIDSNFAFEKPLLVAIGSSTGPLFDLETQTLHMPYGYIAEAVKAQSELVEDDMEALRRALDMVEYTLYHLLGHALIGSQSVDVDEKAESLSTWIMLTHWPNGGEQWAANVLAFADASQKLDGPLSDFWHEHSLSKLRLQELQCWILGSNVEKYQPLFKAELNQAQKQADCEKQWQKLQSESLAALESILLPDAPLRR